MSATGLRPARRALALPIIGLAAVASALVLAYWGRGQTFAGDELAYATRLSHESLGHALLYPPPDGYLIAVPLLLYKAMFATIGLDSYAPYRAVAIALELLCAGLFFLLARRRVGDLAAVPPTVLLLFFGYGAEVVLTAERLPGLIALAAGLGMLLALRHEARGGDCAAAALLATSLASHPSGIAFAVIAAVLVLLRPAPARWRSSWVFLVPVALYAAWWVFLREPATTPMQTQLGALLSFIAQSWTATTASISGLAGVLAGSAYHHTLGWLAAALLLGLVVAGAATRVRRLPDAFWALAAGVLTLWLITALPRGTWFLEAARPADAGRYLYPAAFLVLLMLVELAGAVRLPSWGTWAATAILALGLVANLARLHDEGATGRALAEEVRADYGAVEIAAATVPPDYRPLGFYPTAGDYLDVSRSFGSPADSPAELAAAAAASRQEADGVLIAATGLALRQGGPGSADRARPPVLKRRFQGAAEVVDGCLTLRPAAGAKAFSAPPAVPLPPPPTASAPALAEVTLAPGGASIGARRIAQVGLRLGRFADLPAFPLEMPRAGRAVSLPIPRDGVKRPWELTVYARHEVTLCRLHPG
jgi:hypothetical protein